MSWFYSLVFGITTSWLIKDGFTLLILKGRNFSGRSVFIQLGILAFLVVITSAFFNLIISIYARNEKLHKKVKKIIFSDDDIDDKDSSLRIKSPNRVRADTVLKLIITLLVIIVYISATLLWSQTKVIHPDALKFTKIFQDQYVTITSIGDAPRAIWSALNNCNQYDLNRGRLTNCAAFGLETLIRGYLPFPFISWMTMLVLLINAFLLARLITRQVKPLSKRMTLFCLATLVIILNPMFITSYEMQFIYSKYLCVTFALLFMLSSNRPLKIFFFACAMFSDEIGVLFCMVVAFQVAYNLPNKHGQSVDNAGENMVFVRARDSLILGVCASFSVLLLYYGVLAFAFGTVPTLITGNLLGGNPVSFFGSSLWLLRSVGYGFGLCRLWPSNIGVHNLSTCQVNIFGTVFLLMVLLYALLASRGRIISALKWFRKVVAQRSLWRLHRVISTPDFQLYGSAVFLALFINYGMIRGSMADYGYYPYPILMLVTFLFLSLLFRLLRGRIASIVLVVLISSLALQLPRTLDSIGLRVKMEYLPNGAISAKDFDQIDRAVMKLRRDGLSTTFEQVNNHQELEFNCCNTYTREYFPATGMIKVLIWPRKLPDQ